MENKNLYIIAGYNGAGKTTASFTILPEILECKEFVNADEIAKGLSPFQPDKVAVESGRIMINRINDLLKEGISFAFETTLASKSYKNKIVLAKSKGYSVTLLFFWLQTIELAKDRVAIRVLEGGHDIPKSVIERRYVNGIKNLFSIYLPIVDDVMIFDNSQIKSQLIASKSNNSQLLIHDVQKYNQLKSYYEQS